MTNGTVLTHPGTQFLNPVNFESQRLDQRQHDLCGYCHLYVIKMTWISNLEVYFQQWCWRLAYAFCYVGRLVFVARGRPLSQNTLSCFRIIRRTRLPFEKPLTFLFHSPSAGRCIDILLATDAFENRNTQDKGSCPPAEEGHLSYTWYSLISVPSDSSGRKIRWCVIKRMCIELAMGGSRGFGP